MNFHHYTSFFLALAAIGSLKICAGSFVGSSVALGDDVSGSDEAEYSGFASSVESFDPLAHEGFELSQEDMNAWLEEIESMFSGMESDSA
jgi:hypothetical protein